jgi:hypothetical protein
MLQPPKPTCTIASGTSVTKTSEGTVWMDPHTLPGRTTVCNRLLVYFTSTQRAGRTQSDFMVAAVQFKDSSSISSQACKLDISIKSNMCLSCRQYPHASATVADNNSPALSKDAADCQIAPMS